MNLDVTRKTIPEVLDLLTSGYYQVPKFQREFVWSQPQVFGLLSSIFRARPIGMITAWKQPQGNPQTEIEPLKIKSTAFKNFDEDPAVVHLVLDGKQRLTAMAIAFGGLRAPDDRHLFSGRWFLNFGASADENEDEIIVYKKRSEIDAENLDAVANCIASGLFPLDHYRQFNEISQHIHNRDYYPSGSYPEDSIRLKRSANLAEYQQTFQSFQIPLAELPERVSLAEVCEIFEVLNTTGTKVSTFDIIHNTVFGDTTGQFNLREIFNELSESTEKIRFLFDESRPEFICQLITGSYLLNSSPNSRRAGQKVTSIKGGDLINTPTDFYLEFFENRSLFSSYASSFFDEVIGADFRLKEIPYPASTIIYFALRWNREKYIENARDRFSVEELNSLFRAFFWRNVITGRYDQGFLTKIVADIKCLNDYLYNLIALRSYPQDWCAEANVLLDGLFGSEHKAKSEELIAEHLMDSEIRGALRLALILFLNTKTNYDLLSGSRLDRFSTSGNEKVDLHHIYPRDWCRNNRAAHQVLQNAAHIENCIANLTPLTSASNNRWKTRSPGTAINEFDLTWENRSSVYTESFVDKETFEVLSASVPNPESFWKKRSLIIAREIFNLQKVRR
jgi:uncharacterized protein with ParB-like and HNH nuclease domain